MDLEFSGAVPIVVPETVDSFIHNIVHVNLLSLFFYLFASSNHDVNCQRESHCINARKHEQGIHALFKYFMSRRIVLNGRLTTIRSRSNQVCTVNV